MISSLVRFAAAAALCLVAMTGPSLAKSAKATVRANQRTAVYGFVHYLRGHCGYALATTESVRRAPAHGQVTFVRKRLTLPKNAKVCPGKTATVLYVLYTPQRGYRGKDSLTVDFTYSVYVASARRATRSVTVDIDVK